MKKLGLLILFLILIGGTCIGAEQKGTDKEEYYILRGINYSQEGKILEALREYEKAYAKNNENPITLREMGLAYGGLGEYKRSEEFYKKALTVDPRDQITLKNLALLSYVNGDYTEAESYLEKVSKDSVDNMVLKLRGFILYQKGDLKEAYGLLKTAVIMEDSLDIELCKIYSHILSEEKKYTELYRFLEEGNKRYNNEQTYLLFYTNALSGYFGEYEKAEKVLKRYIVEKETNDMLLIQLAKISLRNEDIGTAEKAIVMVSDSYKYDLDYLILKKEIFEKQNKTDELDKINKIIEKLTEEKS